MITYATNCLGQMFYGAVALSQFQEPLMSSKTSALSRRSLFSGAATVGAVAAATALLPGVVKQSAPVAAALPKPTALLAADGFHGRRRKKAHAAPRD